MTQAFNLSQLANRVDTSGRIDASTALTGSTAVANGGTGAATLAANNILLGNGTGALQVVAPGTSGNVLTSNGTTWQSTAGSSGTGKLLMFTKITSSGTFTKQSGTTQIIAEIYGGGCSGGAWIADPITGSLYISSGGGRSARGVTFYTASPTATYSAVIGVGGASVNAYTSPVGNSGGNSSFGGIIGAGATSAIPGFGQYNTTQVGESGVGGVGGAIGSAAAANSAAGGGAGAYAYGASGAGGSGVIYVWEYS